MSILFLSICPVRTQHSSVFR